MIVCLCCPLDVQTMPYKTTWGRLQTILDFLVCALCQINTTPLNNSLPVVFYRVFSPKTRDQSIRAQSSGYQFGHPRSSTTRHCKIPCTIQDQRPGNSPLVYRAVHKASHQDFIHSLHHLGQTDSIHYLRHWDLICLQGWWHWTIQYTHDLHNWGRRWVYTGQQMNCIWDARCANVCKGAEFFRIWIRVCKVKVTGR